MSYLKLLVSYVWSIYCYVLLIAWVHDDSLSWDCFSWLIGTRRSWRYIHHSYKDHWDRHIVHLIYVNTLYYIDITSVKVLGFKFLSMASDNMRWFQLVSPLKSLWPVLQNVWPYFSLILWLRYRHFPLFSLILINSSKHCS